MSCDWKHVAGRQAHHLKPSCPGFAEVALPPLHAVFGVFKGLVQDPEVPVVVWPPPRILHLVPRHREEGACHNLSAGSAPPMRER